VADPGGLVLVQRPGDLVGLAGPLLAFHALHGRLVLLTAGGLLLHLDVADGAALGLDLEGEVRADVGAAVLGGDGDLDRVGAAPRPGRVRAAARARAGGREQQHGPGQSRAEPACRGRVRSELHRYALQPLARGDVPRASWWDVRAGGKVPKSGGRSGRPGPVRSTVDGPR